MDRACGVRQPPTAPGFTERQGQYPAFIDAYTRVSGRPQSWLGKFGQADEWGFCLRAARMAGEQERR